MTLRKLFSLFFGTFLISLQSVSVSFICDYVLDTSLMCTDPQEVDWGLSPQLLPPCDCLPNSIYLVHLASAICAYWSFPSECLHITSNWENQKSIANPCAPYWKQHNVPLPTPPTCYANTATILVQQPEFSQSFMFKSLTYLLFLKQNEKTTMLAACNGAYL